MSNKKRSRVRGLGNVFQPVVRGEKIATYWLDYSINGKRHRENAHTKSSKEAGELLRQRIGDRRAGKLVGSPDKVKLSELRALHLKQYDLDGLRSKERVVQCWTHLEKFFGAETRVTALNGIRLDDYAAARLAEKAARQTVNNELSALRRGFKLAIEKGLLAVMPLIKLPKVENAGQGFFEDADFALVSLELPEYLRSLVLFLRLTGWRVSEGVGLQWEQVDFDGQVVRLRTDQTKKSDARCYPFSLAPALKELLEKQYASKDGVFVFHRLGHRIGNFRGVWLAACRRAGVAGRKVHDLRRTAVRDLINSGVPEKVAMQLCGWKSRAMLDRYFIVNEADLAAAVGRRFAPPVAVSGNQ